MAEGHHKRVDLLSERGCPGRKIGRVNEICHGVGMGLPHSKLESLIGVAKVGSRILCRYQWFLECGDGERSYWWYRGGNGLSLEKGCYEWRRRSGCSVT